jgi:hypothetical protein
MLIGKSIAIIKKSSKKNPGGLPLRGLRFEKIRLD